MTRTLGHNVSIDMAILWAVETILSFLGLYVAFSHGDTFWLVKSMPFAREAAIRAADVTLLLGVICIVLGLYKPSAILQTRMLTLTMAAAALCSVPVFLLLFKGTPSQSFFFGWQAWVPEVMLYWLLLLVTTRFLYATAMRKGLWTREVVVVGDTPRAGEVASTLCATGPRLFKVTTATVAGARAMRTRPWRTIMVGDAAAAVAPAGTERVVDLDTFWERELGRIDPASLHTPSRLYAVLGAARDRSAARLSRMLDIAAASVLLILSAPVMLLTALAVKLDSPGPIIYSQTRVGLGGRPFVIFKFRSMRVDAERNGVAVWASVRDRRITRVGRFIRNVRLDELPQLVNILRGDMSLVGPRPERPTLVEEIGRAVPFFSVRTMVKPGLTGWAQINSAYTASAAEASEKLSYDLYYVKNRSLVLDVMILVATIRILIFQVGSR